tara:strand:- start:2193 stop:3812 length:1620 start_codon:yes stop_codon:yes gene_type:complete
VRRVFPTFVLLALGCSGEIGAPTGSTDPSAAGVCRNPDVLQLGSAPVRRLTANEYRNTLEDLLGRPLPEIPELPPDAVTAGSFENEALALAASDVHVARWEQSAFAVGGQVADDPETRARLVPCDETDAGCAEEFVASFGRRALRRPLTAEETTRYAAFFEEQRAAIDFAGAVQLTVTAMLQSPQFLYRLEIGGDLDGEHVALSDHEVASRLSYLLWQSMPDDELFAAADAGELQDLGNVAAQTRRMLEHPRARAAIGEYFRQWLHLDRVAGEHKLPELVPEWSPAVAAAATLESQQFAEHVFFEGNLRDLFTSRHGFVSEELAPLYGVAAAPEGTELPAERAGILSRIAFLGGEAHEANGSPPLRGVYVIRRLLCQATGSPPANADTSPPDRSEDMGPMTNRMAFEERTASAECQQCHTRIDGFGFGFEAFDMAGRFRTSDNGLPVDASGFAIGIGNDAAYEGADELQALFAESPTVQDCAVETFFTYAQGRAPEAGDSCQLEALQTAFRAADGDLDEMVVQLVTRPEFLLRPAVESE